MNDSSTLASSTYAGRPGLWHRLLRSAGLEAWFQQAPAAAHAGQEERLMLLLALPDTTRATRLAHAALLANAFAACAAAIEATGGELVAGPPGRLLLAWPATCQPPLAALYAQLRASVRQRANSPRLALSGAAGLGWAGAGTGAQTFDKPSLRAVAGILHESQQLGGELLLTAALHQHLASTVAGQCTLHVAFEVPGHRYPATLYQLASPAEA